MIADRQRLLGLLAQYAENSISPQDFEELIAYMNQPDADPILLQALSDISNDLALKPVAVDDKARIYQQIKNHPDFAVRKPIPFKLRNSWRISAAAILVIGIGAGYLFLRNPAHAPNALSLTKAIKKDKIDIGSKTAVLTLSDGSKVLLGKSNTGIIAKDDGYTVNQQQSLLKYNGISTNGARNILNTITIPQGSNYQLVLSDGTKVWLNTNSSLTYPVAFDGNTREVSLTGEAYFEVAHISSKPFIVNNKMADITVLGTHFNVKAYPDEKMTTTLLSGSVKVSKDKSTPVIITPDQEAVVNLGQNNINVVNVDAGESIAWRKGYFFFNNQNIKDVMQTIAHWYDVDIEYRGSMAGKTFAGSIARFENIETLLKSIELTGVIHFKKEGRRITVMP